MSAGLDRQLPHGCGAGVGLLDPRRRNGRQVEALDARFTSGCRSLGDPVGGIWRTLVVVLNRIAVAAVFWYLMVGAGDDRGLSPGTGEHPEPAAAAESPMTPVTPDDIDVWVGLDVGKSAHHAHALDHDGNTLYDKPLKQDEKAIRTMLGKLSKHGRVLLVVDQPNTIGSLPLTVARNMGIAVAYLPGTAMRRTAQLLPGDAKTDRRDAHVIAWAALKLPETLRDAGPDDETLAALKLLAGHDEDLAHESTRHVNRLRSLLLQTHPAFERALKGERITRDATLALLERYGGPMGVKRAGIEDVKDWAKSNGLRAGRIIDDMFKAIGRQTVTYPAPSWPRPSSLIARHQDDQGRRRGSTAKSSWRTTLFSVPTSMPG